MAKQLALSVLIELPDDVFAAAEVMQSIHSTWHSMVQTLKDRPGLAFKHNEDVMEVRPKVTRRPRKQRLAPGKYPYTVPTPPPEAA